MNVVSPLQPPIDLLGVCTRMADCRTLTLGHLEADAVLDLKRHGYDQTPFEDDDGNVVGLVGTDVAFKLCREGRPLGSKDPAISRVEVPVASTLVGLLETLADNRGALVYGVKTEPSTTQYLGLMTVSDPNRHLIRVALYDLFGALEASLARLSTA